VLVLVFIDASHCISIPCSQDLHGKYPVIETFKMHRRDCLQWIEMLILIAVSHINCSLVEIHSNVYLHFLFILSYWNLKHLLTGDT